MTNEENFEIEKFKVGDKVIRKSLKNTDEPSFFFKRLPLNGWIGTVIKIEKEISCVRVNFEKEGFENWGCYFQNVVKLIKIDFYEDEEEK